MITNKNIVLVSGAIVYKDYAGGQRWFIIKSNKDNEWEIPKVVVRKVESSVRASLRMMGEQCGMNTKVLEEAGRAGGATTINGKSFTQRCIYYLMVRRSSNNEVMGFDEHKWLEYAKALKLLSSKREKLMLRQAKKELTKYFREKGRKYL